jgi:hypothetical protein
MKRIILILIFSAFLIKGKAQSTNNLVFYPDPFVTTATITYTLATTDTVTLEIYDLTGKIQSTILNDSIIAAGTYTINYTPTNLTKGVYLLTFITKHGTINRKIIYQPSASAIQTINAQNLVFQIYPNPASNSISINYSDLKRIEILDLNGRVIKTFIASDKTISVSDIPNGEYIIHVYSEQNELIATEKLFKTE